MTTPRRSLAATPRNPYVRPPRLSPPGSRGKINWVNTAVDLIEGTPGRWYLIGQNVKTARPGRIGYATRKLGPDFVRYFGVEVRAVHLPPRHDDLPSGYDIYIRKTRQKKEERK